MPEQPINEQTRQIMGMPTSGDPAIIDPTTGRPYTADASMRQQEEITRQAEVKEEFNLLQDEKRADVRDEAKVSTLLETPETEDLAEEITEDLNQLKDPLSSIKPRARPKELEQKVGKLYQSAVKKAIELDYISKEEGGEEFDGYRGTKSNLRELDPQSLPTITKFITQALGVFDPNQDVTKAGVYWCAAFVNHILTEMGADTLGKGDRYRRLRAQEYINYGQEVSFDDMQEGDILLFGVPELGKVTHVGFYTGEKDGEYVNMLGGNQRSEKSLGELVNIVPRSLKDIVGVRRVTYDGDATKIIKDQKGDNSIFRYFDTDTYGASFIPSKSRKYNEGGDVEVDGPYSPQNIIQYADKPKDFNKGGAVMNEQMEMAFMQQGGLKDDGMKRDPVSGNEVPNGSMAKEVRDDISAQLSEGEYVVPADVVRYLGVKHFEDLRDKAKSGLQNMEANGRIGGEPVPVGGPQAAPTMPQPQMAMGGDLSPEEMNEINNIMMAQGGMVPTDPYQQQQMQYTQPMAQGLNVGGTVTQPPAVPEIPQVSPYSSFTPSGNFSWENSVSITDTEVPVENEASCEARGLVYNPDTKMCEEPETPVVETPVVGGDDSSPSADQAPTATPWYENTDWSTEGVQNSIDKYFGKESKFGSGISAVVGGVLGGIPGAAVGRYGAQVANLSTARAEIEIRKAMGDTAGAEALQKAVDDQLKASAGLGKADEIVNAFFGSDGDMKVIEDLKAAGINVDSALRDDKLDAFLSNLSLSDKTRLQKFHNFTPGKPVTPAADKQKTLSGVTQAQMDAANAQAKVKQKAAASARRDNRDSGPSGAEVAAAAAQKAAEKEVRESKDKPQGNLGASSGGAGAGGFGGGGGGGVYAGGRATGGLVSRPKKK